MTVVSCLGRLAAGSAKLGSVASMKTEVDWDMREMSKGTREPAKTS